MHSQTINEVEEFQGRMVETVDAAGEPWLIFDTEPLQFSVTASPTAAIPEPSAWALAVAGGLLLLNTVGRQRRAAHRLATISGRS